MFNYEISNVQLERVFEIRDLSVGGVDRALSVASHIDFIVAKDYSMLDFMRRICANFNAVLVFISAELNKCFCFFFKKIG